MQILVIAAKEAEIEPTVEFIAAHYPTATHIHFAYTDIGLTAATFSITRLALTQPTDLIIQAGIAGSFENGYQPGEVVLIDTEQQADLGVFENEQWKNIFDLQLTDENQTPYKKGVLPNPYINHFNFLGIRKVAGISVNTISTDTATISRIQQSYPVPVIESMEGAALHFVGRQLQIPFVQLRSLSNQVGERDKSRWHFTQAIQSLNAKLIELLTHLQQHPISFTENLPA
jgi:futalosine hydrolase